MFLPFYRLSFHILDMMHIFNFHETQLMYFVVPGVKFNPMPNPESGIFTPVFSSSTFTVLALTFGSLTHLN